jgi:phage terminase small subunit
VYAYTKRKEVLVALNERQQAFVREYIVDLNATRAAIRAGYSEGGAYQRGYELLNKREVDVAIRQAIEERAKAVHITAERVIEELAHLAMEAERPADRLKALELLSKRFGLLTDKVEHSGSAEPLRISWSRRG